MVGHPTERLEITISLEPWVNMQPAPCSDGPSAGEPTLSAAEVREAWNESLASLPAVHSSPFQKAAATAAPATTRCSSLSATTVAANATTMLPIPMPRGGAAALVPAGSGNHSPAFASHAAAVTVEAPVYAVSYAVVCVPHLSAPAMSALRALSSCLRRCLHALSKTGLHNAALLLCSPSPCPQGMATQSS